MHHPRLAPGFTKRAGWILLVVLSIIRIVGGVTHVLSEQNPSNITLRIIYGIAESSGVSPLLVATLGFLATVGQGSIETHPLMARGLPLMGILGMVGLCWLYRRCQRGQCEKPE
ncbi:hypothetical protein A0H81_00431 [Grifola frondosa]|uniref:DUF7702 domain-containing protein n=1 Tax=Grifola frondosa TaxID=5627 RepID=A0A1C7MR78_GRIFR|nr:hypothetical protein A0H81_00431 [Grifola frondosa]